MPAAHDGFIDTIADHLRSKTYSRREVETVVRFEIEHNLPQQIKEPYLYGLQGDNRGYADDIRNLVQQLLQKLEGAPAGTRNALLILASRTEPERWSLHDGDSPAAKVFKQKLLKGLTDLQRACDDILNDSNTIGDHHNRDRAKELCAYCALELIVGLNAGKPTSSSPNSPIRVISGALFKAIAPNRVMKRPDLRDKCVDAIARWRGMSDADRAAHIDRLWSNWEFTGMIARKSVSST